MVTKKVKIGDRLVGEGEPCFIIAEAGVNHNGDVNLAKKLIDVAKEAQVDAVKFQTFKADEVMIVSAEKAEYQKETTGLDELQHEMIRKLELIEGHFKELSTYAKGKNILFLSSPFDKGSVDLLDELGVLAFKIGSGEITNFPLLKYIAQKGKPIILSTGMSTLDEIEQAIEAIRKQGVEDIILLHCVSCYPTEVKDMNLKAIETLRQAFKIPVGLSDHSLGITVLITAVATGAHVIEKHFTLDKDLPGPDHRASLEPDELEQMVTAIRDVEEAKGDGVKKLTKGEEENKKAARRSIVARVEIPVGMIITKEMLDIKRPGTGIEPKHLDKVIGRKVKIDIKRNALMSWNNLEEVSE